MSRVHDEISEITAEGLVDTIGKLHRADIIVCTTGFDVLFKPSFSVTGVDGLDMAEAFTPLLKVYLSIASPKFPNYFSINGFRGSWAIGATLNLHEAYIEYILTCTRRLQNEHIHAIEIRPDAIKSLYEHIDQ